MNSESVLSARDISFRWKEDQPLLEDISLDVARGQTLAILGPNGAGKTTLLSILSGRLSPRAGSVNLDSRPLISYSARERSRLIAFLPQLEKLAFNYRVLDFVLMGRTPCMEVLALPGKEDEEAALKALSLFGLDSFSMRNIGELSGGEFQLVRIARCLAQGASILILDEPASMLDPAHSRHIADALAS
ncbi:MAG TPA: ABC transporter ATP-binding protein, partial [Rectinema sp.]|nr:ABC transporter ATP-binding protein [Rectinema sp.]